MTRRTDDSEAMTPAEKLVEMKRLRRSAMRKLADALQVWRHCGRPACRRAGSCGAANPTTCAQVGAQALLSDKDKAVFQFALKARLAGVPVDTVLRQAEVLSERLDAENA